MVRGLLLVFLLLLALPFLLPPPEIGPFNFGPEDWKSSYKAWAVLLGKNPQPSANKTDAASINNSVFHRIVREYNEGQQNYPNAGGEQLGTAPSTTGSFTRAAVKASISATTGLRSLASVVPVVDSQEIENYAHNAHNSISGDALATMGDTGNIEKVGNAGNTTNTSRGSGAGNIQVTERSTMNVQVTERSAIFYYLLVFNLVAGGYMISAIVISFDRVILFRLQKGDAFIAIFRIWAGLIRRCMSDVILCRFPRFGGTVFKDSYTTPGCISLP